MPVIARKELSDITTLAQAAETLSPSLKKITKLRGGDFTLAFLKGWIVDLQKNLNIKNRMSEEMIDICAEEILTSFGYLTIPDVKNIFTDALKGVYGEFYESLSVPKIISWFNDYFERRCAYFEGNHMSEHSYTKNQAIGWTNRVREKQKSVTRNMLLTDDDMKDIERGKNES